MKFNNSTEIKRFVHEYAFLSNFHHNVIELWGYTWPTTEHAYQAAKTLSLKEFETINQVPWPYMAKKLGKYCFLRSDWNNIKDDVMLECLIAKFTQHPELLMQLNQTGNKLIVEGNFHYDNYWGQCPPDSTGGQNKLGKLLMSIRMHFSLFGDLDSLKYDPYDISVLNEDLQPSAEFDRLYLELMD